MLLLWCLYRRAIEQRKLQHDTVQRTRQAFWPHFDQEKIILAKDELFKDKTISLYKEQDYSVASVTIVWYLTIYKRHSSTVKTHQGYVSLYNGISNRFYKWNLPPSGSNKPNSVNNGCKDSISSSRSRNILENSLISGFQNWIDCTNSQQTT